MFSAAKSRQSILPSLAVLSAAAFGLNFPWEMLQMPAYAEMAGRPWPETAFICLAASLGDAAITLGIYGLVALFSLRQEVKVKRHHHYYYALASLLGAVSAVAIERVALSLGRWSYMGLMPVVPVLGVGLWPLLQLTLLVPAALGITFFTGKKWGLS